MVELLAMKVYFFFCFRPCSIFTRTSCGAKENGKKKKKKKKKKNKRKIITVKFVTLLSTGKKGEEKGDDEDEKYGEKQIPEWRWRPRPTNPPGHSIHFTPNLASQQQDDPSIQSTHLSIRPGWPLKMWMKSEEIQDKLASSLYLRLQLYTVQTL